MKRLNYSNVGDNYDTKDPVKKLAQHAAATTAKHLKSKGFPEVKDSRGESAFVWRQGKQYMASVVEGLGTKSLIADAMQKVTKKTYYDAVGYDTVATIINDLTTVGATPLVLHAYWAIEDNSWLLDKKRMADLIRGWKEACDIAGVAWGGGETPTLKGIAVPGTIDLAGSAIGIIPTQKRLLTDTNLQAGDRIVLLQSSGINANGVSLARAVASRLPKGYATKLPSSRMYGEALLTKTHIYAPLLEKLYKANIDIHYAANITGHGLRKIMRGRPNYTYVIEKIFEPQEEFQLIQDVARLSDYEMYQTFNMGVDYALFVAPKDIEKALGIIKKSNLVGIDAGAVEVGNKQVVLKSKRLTYDGSSLDLR